MAKIYGLFGAMTGKLADAVMVVRNGEQLVRKYQPVVSNPSTPAQIAARAKLKLASQLSAVMAPVVAMPSVGPVSSRNRFVKENYGALTYQEGMASANLEAIQLTKSVVALPSLDAVRVNDGISVSLSGAERVAGVGVDRVVYCMFVKQADNTLRFATSLVSSTPGEGDSFAVKFPLTNLEAVIYAYGVRDNNEAAKAMFGNMTTISGEEVAKLIVTSTLKENDITLTETRSTTVQAAD